MSRSRRAGKVNAEMARARATIVTCGHVGVAVRIRNRQMRYETKRRLDQGEFDNLPRKSKPAAWDVY